MKVLPFTIPKPENVTLYTERYKGENFYEKLHQHKEIQISVVIAGEGTFVIGDCVGDFKQHDIFVLGENLPHVFKRDKAFKQKTEMVSLFFSKNSFGEDFFNLPEFSFFKKFFDNAVLGYKVQSYKQEISLILSKIKTLSKYYQFINFLEVLRLISEAEKRELSSLINLKKYAGNEGKRMSDIFQYTMDNFHKEVTLHDVANIANMTPNAFCRYFKQRTTKTFVNFLIDIRIGNACKLLAKNNDLSITEISYKSGFNNLANFNRKFKSIKGITPSEYRKKR
ncbi:MULTISPECIES: AraC family transcriptional regulator [Flavobacteriaceae]|uniref:AraC family transcriptional regulator n=2 Tax=Flavobacteriaceae TaxID=49546 RepID=A0A4Y8AUA5_9FLAO|nr:MULTISPECIES: AraC family transcriptional regulator [Flavobacteriaceae]TEW74956.1 AraC family transcriptional regulator [Gramella jeungdoensis]GGK42773.1 AraC family transcriptional regulator [Lutibacter litoralis]